MYVMQGGHEGGEGEHVRILERVWVGSGVCTMGKLERYLVEESL